MELCSSKGEYNIQTDGIVFKVTGKGIGMGTNVSDIFTYIQIFESTKNIDFGNSLVLAPKWGVNIAGPYLTPIFTLQGSSIHYST